MILITECYSGENLGDRELVDATLDKVTQIHPNEEVHIVALDDRIFKVMYPRVTIHKRMFDRIEYNSRTGIPRLHLLVQWMLSITLLSGASMLPSKYRRQATERVGMALPRGLKPTALAYMTATHVYPVGGGYIGDRYIKESALTLWTWWFSQRSGAAVTTMPISIEAEGSLLKTLLRKLAGEVNINVRDRSSKAVAESCALDATYVPDLAFRNYESRHDGLPSSQNDSLRVLIVPVAGDYFDERTWQWQVDEILAYILNHPQKVLTSTFEMHHRVAQSSAGQDGDAVKYIEQSLPKHASAGRLEAASYRALCESIRLDFDLVISARMHAGIAALCSETPLVLLGYEEKHSSLMNEIGMTKQAGYYGRTTEAALAVMVDAAINFDETARSVAIKQLKTRLDDWAS
ncbi:polysaccharide pyruvyl transferase family protein [Williamsia soli]|uniref:polysaccharide pyruvyl transferase family protein n=1 Tax=Williamsia soli TaxID=364929 RepID=UPI001A9E2940|nr:polysaccharide pyruvyl transferase family protein [Williamsia soli]